VDLDKKVKDTLKTSLGAAIELVPGKSEEWLMVLFDDNQDVYFKGKDNAPLAFVEVGIKGHASRDDFQKLGAAITQSLSDYAKVEPANIYISYSEFDTFSWNGRLL
jgi:hypothetical protein